MGFNQERKGKKTFSAYYKRAFKEGYNNPSQHKDVDLNKKLSPNAEKYRSGLIAGVLRSQRDRQNNVYSFIMSDKDLGEKIE